MSIRWPFVRRATYDAVCAERDAAEARARRRSKRHATAVGVSRATHKATVDGYHRPVRELTDLAAVQEPLGADAAGDVFGLPVQVIEAIEFRAGSLSTRTARGMLAAAGKALEAGQDADTVAEWMVRGEAAH